MKVLYNGEYIELHDDEEEQELDKLTDEEIKLINQTKDMDDTMDFSNVLGEENE